MIAICFAAGRTAPENGPSGPTDAAPTQAPAFLTACFSERYDHEHFSLDPADLPALLDLTLATFGPFLEHYYRPAVGEQVFLNMHGDWREDYARC